MVQKQEILTVRVKLDICEYFIEYKTVTDIKNYFKSKGYPYIRLTTFDNYDGRGYGNRISVDDLTQSDIEWVNEPNEYGSKYLQGQRG